MSKLLGDRSFVRSTFACSVVVGTVGMLTGTLVPYLGSFAAHCLVACLVVGLSITITRYIRSQTQQSLAIVETAVITGEKPTGDSEFHRAADNLVSHVARLASVAAKGREQSREVEGVLMAFDRRSARIGKANPSHQLAMLLKSLGTDAQNAIEETVSISDGIKGIQHKIKEASHQQGELINKAAGEIDLLAQSIDDVHSTARQAKTNDSTTTDVAESVSSQLMALQQQLEKLRDLIVNCEQKSQLVREQTVEISALMQVIQQHASKSDTMALNASIESVRAGEHGRGFAAAADEIRKLTGIISDSAGDVLDRLNRVEGNVSETHGICSEGHSTIDEQLNAARELAQAMAEIRQTTHQSRHRLDEVAQASDTQLQTISAITEILELVLNEAEGTGQRIGEEEAAHAELTTSLNRLAHVLSPLTAGRAATAKQPGVIPETHSSDGETRALETVGAST